MTLSYLSYFSDTHVAAVKDPFITVFIEMGFVPIQRAPECISGALTSKTGA
jgi:hypothetical protein